ncbi:hypothetical protein ACFL0D_00460 [Thermoproteota archaeon]
MSQKEEWKKTTTVLVILSIIIGVIQRTPYQFLDEVFEVFIFHIPPLISFVIYCNIPPE